MTIGTLVEWESEAAGIKRMKRGEIVEVVPPLGWPRRRVDSGAAGRDHESYVVKARAQLSGGRQGRAKLYWPVAKRLRVVDFASVEQATREGV